MEGMQRRNMYFPDAIWERLLELSNREGVAIADVLRRLLGDALGLHEEALAHVQLAADGDDPLPKLRRDLLRERLERTKLATVVARLSLDVTTLAEADAPRREAWENMKARVDTLHQDTQSHIERSESLFRQTAETIAGLYAGLQDCRQVIEAQNARVQQFVDAVEKLTALVQHHDAAVQAHYTALKQLGMLDVDVLRRLSALETGVWDDQAQEARERGDTWLSSLEADVLARTSGETERDAR